MNSIQGDLNAAQLSEISESKLFNADLAPVLQARRTWTMWSIAALWVGMAICITTYTLASGLISQGMNWSEAILTIFLGNVIVLIPMTLNAHPGTKFGIPFPVLLRSSFGTLGSNIPALLRALVACGCSEFKPGSGARLFTRCPPLFLNSTPRIKPISQSSEFLPANCSVF
ncbi:MAG: cytosine permease [Limisphaerales bacterium]